MDISIIQHPWIYQIHIVHNVSVSNIVGETKLMQKSQLLGKYLARLNYSPKTTSK